MVVEAKEMVYDEKKNTVTAQGQVQILYKGRLLEADRVVYDRNTSRVFAEGHATLTETDGTIARADRFDLTDDFKNGFIESLQVDAANDTHFSSPRAERAGRRRRPSTWAPTRPARPVRTIRRSRAPGR